MAKLAGLDVPENRPHLVKQYGAECRSLTGGKMTSKNNVSLSYGMHNFQCRNLANKMSYTLVFSWIALDPCMTERDLVF